MRTITLMLLLLLAGSLLAKEMPDRVRIMPTRHASMIDVYAQNKARGLRTYITSDSMLQSTHVLMDYTLRAVELQQLYPRLAELTTAMAARMTQLAEEEACKRYIMAPPPYGYDRVAAYFGVAQRLLDPHAKTPEISKGLVDAELALITAHNKAAVSPILGVTEDYTQYMPRGHYTRNEQFRRYFLAMLWYGRAGFAISGEKQPFVPLTQEEKRANAWAGIVLARELNTLVWNSASNSGRGMEVWQSIYKPTAFLVGQSDDLTPPAYLALTKRVFGDTLPGGWTADAQAKTDQFIAEAIKLHPPRILGTVQSDLQKNPLVALRLMGQRFVLDSEIFIQLVHPRVPGRLLPSGLDVMAVFGSPTAVELLQARKVYEQYPTYGAQVETLQKAIGAYTDAQWSATAYHLWLNTLRGLVNESAAAPTDLGAENAKPAYWGDPVWKLKQLNAGLGSWAELRHDAILYAKQSYTGVKSDAPQLTPEPAYTVEPVPQVYGGLIRLLSATRENLEGQGGVPKELAPNYDEMTRLLRALLLISTQERHTRGSILAPTPDDFARVRNVANILRTVETLPEPLRKELTGDEDAQAALIADVHTDPNSGKVLEVGVGHVYTVAVPVVIDANGEVKGEAYGPIFSYYEFAHPMNERLTDAQWQTMLQQNTAPAPFVLGADRMIP